MDNRSDRRGRVAALRRTGRVWSVVSVGLLLGLVVGEGVYPSGPGEWIGFLFLLSSFRSRRPAPGAA